MFQELGGRTLDFFYGRVRCCELFTLDATKNVEMISEGSQSERHRQSEAKISDAD